ncbi:MAG TPA: ABC transporter substrate-binding protein [Dehalococcoidia bacterium]|nr:ABC transporter substrate-binding protein [Dehalococcoidia bacterium]
MRKGVKFHDDSDLTAADVKFSIERMIAPQSTTQSQATMWKALVEAVEQKDDWVFGKSSG